LQNNSLHICFETLASYSSTSCQNKYSKRKKKKKKKKTFDANFYLVVVVVVVDILKPNHSPKTAANRQVRLIRPGVGGLLGAKCKHVADL
jgi:hypothetical protein